MVFADSKSHGEITKVFYRNINESDVDIYKKYLQEIEDNDVKYFESLNAWDRLGKKTSVDKPKKLKVSDKILDSRVFEVFNFLNNINYFIKQPEKYFIPIAEVKVIRILFVSSCYFEELDVINNFTKTFIQCNDSKEIIVEFKTHFELLIELMKKINTSVEKDENTFGKRYGNPVLDLIREFNKHLFITKVDGSSKAPLGEESFKEIKRKENQNKLMEMFKEFNECVKKAKN